MRADRAGYTLLELLVVIGLVAALMGLGVGFLGRRGGNDLERARVLLEDMARAARTQARFHRSSARLVMVPGPGAQTPRASEEARQLVIIGQKLAAEWNFETGVQGSQGITVMLTSGAIDEGGRIGMGLWPDATASAPALRLDTEQTAKLGLSGGFLVRVDVKVFERHSGTAVRLGETFELGVDQSGVAMAAVTMARDGGRPGRRLRLTGLRRLPIGEWCNLALAVDGVQAALFVDHIEEASEMVAEACYVDPRAQLVVSDGGAPWHGVLDTVEVFSVEELRREALPQLVDVLAGPAALHFDADGLVDRRRHADLPRYLLRLDDQSETIDFEAGGLPK